MPPFRIRPGLPPTPGKFITFPMDPTLKRISVLVPIVRESPGNVALPLVGGRIRVLFAPGPTSSPLNTSPYVLPATCGPTNAPVSPAPNDVALVFQIAAVHAFPPACTLVVVRFAARDVNEQE